MKILVVEDESDIAELLEFNLKREGYEVEIASDGESSISKVDDFKPDLVLLDIMLPGIGGIEVCRRLRARDDYKNLPIIMVTAKGSEVDTILGFEAGADDYVVKPFSPMELMARIRALLRRSRYKAKAAEQIEEDSTPPPGSMCYKGLCLNPTEHWVKIGNTEINLTKMEFDVLHTLLKKPGQVFKREDLLKSVSEDIIVGDRTIDVHIAALRRKLGDYGSSIKTIRGVGYKFSENVKIQEC